MTSLATHPQGRARPARWVVAILMVWVALGIALGVHRVAESPAFDYRHAWVSAHFATIGRSYLELGLDGLHAIQVQNGLPQTSETDIYYGMPPLYGGYVALGMALLGDQPGALHAWQLLLTLATAAVIGLLCRRAFGWPPALFAVGTFLLMPVTVRYGLLLANISLSILFTLIALTAWMTLRTSDGRAGRAPLLVGMVAVALATLASWEPVLLVPIWLAQAWRSRSRRDAGHALWLGAAILVALATVGWLFRLHEPAVADQMWQRLLFRTGMGTFDPVHLRVHALPEHMPSPLSWGGWVRTWIHDLGLLGVAGLCGLAVLAGRGPAQGAFRQPVVRDVLVPCALLIGLYSIALRGHFQLHDFLAQWMAPCAAIASGYAAWWLAAAGHGLAARAGAGVVIAAGLVTGIVGARAAGWSLPEEVEGMELGKLVDAHAARPAVVLTPLYSMIPVYYGHRHFLRGVEDDAAVATYRERIRALCPCRFYLAAAVGQEADFPALLSGSTLVVRTRRLVLYDVSAALERPGLRRPPGALPGSG